MMHKSVCNQFGFGIGYRNSKIYSTNKHMVWITYGYKTISWSWKMNPARPIKND